MCLQDYEMVRRCRTSFKDVVLDTNPIQVLERNPYRRMFAITGVQTNALRILPITPPTVNVGFTVAVGSSVTTFNEELWYSFVQDNWFFMAAAATASCRIFEVTFDYEGYYDWLKTEGRKLVW